MKVLLVGAGQIGSRHLQALAGLPSAKITVVDPHQGSLDVAQERFQQVKGTGATFKTALEAGETFDAAIIATSAGVRRQILEDLIEKRATQRFLLEKVLFPRLRDYKEVGELIRERKVNAWVNCPMRLWPAYSQLKEQIDSPLRMTVSGSNWGLACNSIHYVDIFSFLLGTTPSAFEIRDLDKKIHPSKREGYVEFSGTWSSVGADSNESSIALQSWPTGSVPVQITLETTTMRATIREDLQKMWVSNQASNWAVTEQDFPIPYQSQLTHKVIESMVSSDRCGLPTYEESRRVHELLIAASLEHLAQHGQRVETCPIT